MFARQFADNEIFSGLIFTGSLLLLSFFLNLPITIFSTFVIEERFGFKKQLLRFSLPISLKVVLLLFSLGALFSPAYYSFS